MMNDIFLDNKYTRWYYAIVQQRAVIDGRYETHHILPSSLGGSDDAENLVKVSPRVHFICHWLLTRMTVGSDRVSMLRAFWMMKAVNQNRQRYINSRAYQALKEEYALVQSERVSGENNPMAGDKFYRSEEGEARRQLVMTGDTNPAKRPEVGKAISDAKTGVPREPFSDEWRANLRAAKIGDKNPRYNVALSDELKDTLRELASDRTWIKKNTEEKRVKNNVLQSYLDDAWVVGRIERPRKKRGPYKKRTEIA